MAITDWPSPGWNAMSPAASVTTVAATTGWECPKCGHVYAPCVASCWHCPQQPVTASETSAGCTCGTTVACQVHRYTPTQVICNTPGLAP